MILRLLIFLCLTHTMVSVLGDKFIVTLLDITGTGKKKKAQNVVVALFLVSSFHPMRFELQHLSMKTPFSIKTAEKSIRRAAQRPNCTWHVSFVCAALLTML